MTVTGHVPEGMNIFQAVDAGMDQINHIQYVADVMIPPGKKPAGRPTRDQRMAMINAIEIESPEAKKAIEYCTPTDVLELIVGVSWNWAVPPTSVV